MAEAASPVGERRKYLYEAQGPAGPATGHVEAESVAQARKELAARGYANVVVLSDDFEALIRKVGEGESGQDIDADLEVLLRRDPTAASMTWYAMRRNSWAVAVCVIAIAALAAFDLAWWAWMIAVGVLGGLGYLLARPGWLQWRQNEMYRRYWAGDWEASEAIARGLRRMELIARLDSAKLELDARIACCLVRKGQRDAAFALLEPWARAGGLPATLYLVKKVALHFEARDWADVIATQERILEVEKDADFARIDLAHMIARMGDDDARAQELLDSLDPARATPLHDAFIGWGRGVLALRRGDDAAAMDRLVQATDRMQGLAANPMVWGALALCTGYLAVAVARSGRIEAARGLMKGVEPIVRRHGEDRLLDWLRQANVAS